MTPLCPIRTPPELVSQAHRLAVKEIQLALHSFSHVGSKRDER